MQHGCLPARDARLPAARPLPLHSHLALSAMPVLGLDHPPALAFRTSFRQVFLHHSRPRSAQPLCPLHTAAPQQLKRRPSWPARHLLLTAEARATSSCIVRHAASPPRAEQFRRARREGGRPRDAPALLACVGIAKKAARPDASHCSHNVVNQHHPASHRWASHLDGAHTPALPQESHTRALWFGKGSTGFCG
jgi:hypothetical protein